MNHSLFVCTSTSTLASVVEFLGMEDFVTRIRLDDRVCRAFSVILFRGPVCSRNGNRSRDRSRRNVFRSSSYPAPLYSPGSWNGNFTSTLLLLLRSAFSKHERITYLLPGGDLLEGLAVVAFPWIRESKADALSWIYPFLFSIPFPPSLSVLLLLFHFMASHVATLFILILYLQFDFHGHHQIRVSVFSLEFHSNETRA